MSRELQVNQHNLYNADYLKWLETTLEQLRLQNFAQVDWQNLIEEIEAMARNERRRLNSNLIVLFMHLLKWQYQPERRSGSWKSSIIEHRRRIRDDLEDSPSLKPYLLEVIEKCYQDALEQAAAETGLPQDTFPEACPYTIAEILDTNFPPESA